MGSDIRAGVRSLAQEPWWLASQTSHSLSSNSTLLSAIVHQPISLPTFLLCSQHHIFGQRPPALSLPRTHHPDAPALVLDTVSSPQYYCNTSPIDLHALISFPQCLLLIATIAILPKVWFSWLECRPVHEKVVGWIPSQGGFGAHAGGN